ncbi:unnamed protein product [Rhodiola kirilowii]
MEDGVTASRDRFGYIINAFEE